MQRVYHPESGSYVAIEQDPLIETVAELKAKRPPVIENEAASLLDAGDGILLLEFHSKMNTLDSAFFPILASALEELHGNATGLIIANDGPHFSLGANLRSILASAEAGDWAAIEQSDRRRASPFSRPAFRPQTSCRGSISTRAGRWR